MNFLLEFTKEQFTQDHLRMTDILTSGLEVVLTGMLTVFGVLILLWMTLVAFKFFFHDLPARQKTSKDVSAEPAPVQQAVEASNDEEIIAVIAAAIAMAENECGSNKQFRVVSFNRK